MKVLAFDIATNVGIAFGRAGEIPRATNICLGVARNIDGKKLAKMIEATEAFVSRTKPDLIVYEAPIGGPKTSHFLVAVAGCFLGQAVRMGYDPKPVNIASVRKHFLGKHLIAKNFPHLKPQAAKLEIKRAVVAGCLSRGWDVETHDEADACAIWDYACATFLGAHTRTPGGLV